MHYRARLLRIVFIVAITSAPALPARADQTITAASASAAVAHVQIENFGQVSDRYFRGAQPEGGDYRDLAALGVRTIIDLQEADGDPNEERLAREAGITYQRIPMNTHRPPTTAELAQFFKLVSDPAKGGVYVHCKGGRHRTGVMTAAYRMSFDGWSAEKSYDEMKRYDFGPSYLHPEFKQYVHAYDVKRVPLPVVAATSQQ